MTSPTPYKITDNIVALLVGLILAGSAILFACSSPFHLFAAGTRVDLGNVSIGQSREETFTISNPSSSPIVIVDWAPTCHCIQARFPDTVIPPRSSLHAYVRTTAVTPLGQRSAAIAIEWHFAGESLLRTDKLVVSSRYVSPLSLSEDRLDFSDVLWNQEKTDILLARYGNTDEKWNELEVEPDSDRLSARIRSTPAGFQISTHFYSRGLPSGVWKSSLKLFMLENGVKTGQELDVPVLARIKGPFRAYPPVLQLFGHPNSPLFFTLRIHSQDGLIRELHLLGDVVQKPAITISNDGKDALITGTLAKPTNGIFVGRIPLQINTGPLGALAVSFIGYPG